MGAKVDVWRRYVAANVYRLRVRKGLSQEQLAELADLAARYVQEVERARSNLSLDVLVRLADKLGVDPRRLLRPAQMPPARSGRPPKRR